VLELALKSLQNRCPKEMVPYLITKVRDPGSLIKIKTACIRSLAASREPEAFEVLLELVWRRRWLLRNSLAPKSATMLAALAGIARHWPREPRTTRLLQSALRSSDAQIQTVARTGGGGS
jgi:hypothetical protein